MLSCDVKYAQRNPLDEGILEPGHIAYIKRLQSGYKVIGICLISADISAYMHNQRISLYILTALFGTCAPRGAAPIAPNAQIARKKPSRAAIFGSNPDSWISVNWDHPDQPTD